MIADATGTVRALLVGVAEAAIPRPRTTSTTTDVGLLGATVPVAVATIIADAAHRVTSTTVARGTDARRLVGLLSTVLPVLVTQTIHTTLVDLRVGTMTRTPTVMLVRTKLALLPPGDAREAQEDVLLSIPNIPLAVTRSTLSTSGIAPP
jgi:hypothetical protein